MVIPPRSRLYALPPIGVGTPAVESLTSYIARLAEAHCVFCGLLMRKEVIPLFPGYVAGTRRGHNLFPESGERSTLINGSRFPARYVVQALETLTLRTDLHYLTLLPLAKVLPKNTVLRLTKAWCPSCYEEWRAAGQTIYEPLLWSLREVSVCLRHQQPLCLHCPYPDCARPLPGVAWRSRVGYCSYCQRWLGRSPNQLKESNGLREAMEQDWQRKIIWMLGDALARLPMEPPPERQQVRQVVQYAVQQFADEDFAAFARWLGASWTLVHWWYQGAHVPELSLLLQLCSRLGLSLSEFLFREPETLHLSFKEGPPLLSSVPRKQSVIDHEALYAELEQIRVSEKQPPVPLKAVVQQLDCEASTLRRIHPVACQTIVGRYKAYVQHRREARFQKIYEEIREVAQQLQAEGRVLKMYYIAPRLSKPGVLRNPEVRAVMDEICRELEEGT